MPTPADAPAGLDLHAPLFVIGAPRSGTTWLQRLLASVPQVVSGQETNLFDKYVAPLDETFARQVRQVRELPRVKGLPTLLSRPAFDALLRDLVVGTYAELGRLKPGATIVVDKNPPHTLHVPLIRRLLPGARFVHLVRDGRDVAASLVAAHAGWGRYWAPARVVDAAAVWRRHVLAARQVPRDDGLLEVRYEQLRADGPAVLRRVFAFAGVDVDLEAARQVLAGQELAGAPGSDSLVWGGEVCTAGGRLPAEPVGFVRSGLPGTWQQEWSAVERAAFDTVAGELLVELGYAPDRSWVAAPGWARQVSRLQSSGSSARRAVLHRARRLVQPRG